MKELEKIEPADTEMSVLAVIARAVTDPRMDVEKMERLFALQQQIMEQERKTAFFAALSRLAPRLPQIDKKGVQLNKDGVTVRNKYAKFEHIDEAVRPLLAEEGFAFSFDSTVSADGRMYTFTGRLSHRDGHSTTTTLPMPLDNSTFRTPGQNVSSTIQQGRRNLVKMCLNIVERDEDEDMGDPITAEEADVLDAKLRLVGADLTRFLKLMGVQKIADILHRDLQKAHSAIAEKRPANPAPPEPANEGCITKDQAGEIIEGFTVALKPSSRPNSAELFEIWMKAAGISRLGKIAAVDLAAMKADAVKFAEGCK